jgi:hypothetical protein
MVERPESPPEATERRTDAFPDGLESGSTILIATAGDPSAREADLRALRRYGRATDAAAVVTTTESADRTRARYEALDSDAGRPSLGLVDLVSERQYVTALYSDVPVVYTPSPSDLGRLVIALSELSRCLSPSTGTRHLVVRSLTPLLRNASVARVCAALEQISTYRTGGGLCLYGIDYTAHDEETMRILTDRVDGVLWVTEASDGHAEYSYRQTRGRYRRTSRGTDGG